MTAWIFQAKPQDFDMDAFLASKPTKAKWRASAPGMNRKCRIGDRVFLWRAKGTGASALAGVVAEGTVCGSVVEQADDSAAARFWTGRAAARLVEPRNADDFCRTYRCDNEVSYVGDPAAPAS